MPLYDARGREIQQPDIHDPRGVSPEDAELLARMVAELRAMDEGEPMVIALSPLSAIQLAGLLQLALRHDGTAADIRAAALRFLDAVWEYFAACPAVRDILVRGFDPAYDTRPRSSSTERLRLALEALVQLQGHYGARHAFTSADEWLARLDEMDAEEARGPR